MDRTTVGYNYKGLFKNGVTQIPAFGGWGGGEAALVFNPGGFEAGGPKSGLYANKYMPSASDTVTKVIGTHTIKGGGFWERIRNSQPANNYTNGFSLVDVGNSNSLGNAYADLLTGTLNSYQETNFNRINDISYNTYEGFVQDSWKVSRRLTLELGLRPRTSSPGSTGWALDIPSSIIRKYSSSCTPLQYCGFEWNKKNSAVPIGGFPTRALFWQPRFGVAYDIAGKGKTVLRGGWGRYYYHSGQFTAGLDVSAGVVSRSLGNNVNGVPAAGQATRHAECRRPGIQPGGSGQQGRPATLHGQLSASPFPSGCHGRVCSRLRTWAIRARICKSAAEPAATSTWFRSAPCCRAGMAEWIPTASRRTTSVR